MKRSHMAKLETEVTKDARATATIECMYASDRVFTSDAVRVRSGSVVFSDWVESIVSRDGKRWTVTLVCGRPPKPKSEPKPKRRSDQPRRVCDNEGCSRPAVTRATDSSGVEGFVCARCSYGDRFERCFG